MSSASIGVVTSTLVFGFVAAGTSGRSPGMSRLAKMAASSSMILVFVLAAPHAQPYAAFVAAALIASWIGDLALSFDTRTSFLTGLVAFALAHVLYTLGFMARGPLSAQWVAVGAAAMGLVGALTLKWLAPHRPEEMRIPLASYVVIIGGMTAFAFGTLGHDPDPLIPLAATAFAASDIFVARQQFVTTSTTNRIIGLPLYYAAQLLLALSTAAG